MLSPVICCGSRESSAWPIEPFLAPVSALNSVRANLTSSPDFTLSPDPSATTLLCRVEIFSGFVKLALASLPTSPVTLTASELSPDATFAVHRSAAAVAVELAFGSGCEEQPTRASAARATADRAMMGRVRTEFLRGFGGEAPIFAHFLKTWL
ncbi:hypothetical protein [Microbacterium elymi]|uniref:Uncharacterized protein n=1 Tax=Microbacterium elymi TaxID=2909587 RepID=A0ABY5NIT1_9MICO|nr:hypothetical protein [Microbacterium elymi]UUT35058.1 hypothetical protein L2X98_32680 [Microbacterium elymi]